MPETKERFFIFFALGLIMATFFAFGFFHLGKFETTDEHLWKYDRIGQYWSALGSGDWEQTYINDKPGVTVALISGIGLLLEPHPETTEMRAPADGLFERYNWEQSVVTNIHFRLPVLIFTTLSLLAFFSLIASAFGSLRLALLGTLLIATAPILVGMAQIINPDSFFWIFGGLSVLAYLTLLRTGQSRFILLTGLLTGLALLSKYTAFILFAFYGLALFFTLLSRSDTPLSWKTLGQHILHLASIFLISITLFALLLPAVFVEPEYLFKGISQFFDAEFFSLPVVVALAFLFALVFFVIRRFPLEPIVTFIRTKERYFYGSVASLFLLLLTVSFLNVWTGQKLVPVDALRDAAYANEPQSFNFRPLIPKGAPELGKNLRLSLLESYPLFFSLSPSVLLVILFGTVQLLRNKLPLNSRILLGTVLAFALLYFASTLFAKVVTNARYLILLYPLFSLSAAVVLYESLLPSFSDRKHLFLGTVTLLFLVGGATLWQIRPFYFSYTNSLLPNQFSIHDSWGHGAYEAASYLNTLPNASELIIWSNSDTVCRFFQGNCLRSRKIDLTKVTPDYFVISKRGAIKTSNRFLLENNPNPTKDSNYYFDKLDHGFIWQLEILNRPDNYIKIIPFEPLAP